MTDNPNPLRSDSGRRPVSLRGNASVRSRAAESIPDIIASLDSPRTDERRKALSGAASSFDEGLVARPHETGWCNVLARTMFSTDGSSPARLAWEAVIRGLSVIGSADCDNLGALGEMFSAGDVLGIRATVSMETQTRVPSREDTELNRPGQPGSLRVMAAGFTRVPPLDSGHGRLIAALPAMARERNAARIEGLNALLTPVAVDFERDVLPLTPAGNATETHICAAYADKAAGIFSALHDQAVFWADVLGRSPSDTESLLGDRDAFMEVLADRLAGLGDDRNQAVKHPAVTEFFSAATAAGAIPCLLWRDGSSAGERDPARLLDDAVGWGARAVALYPDRLWNVADPAEKETRLAALAAMIAAARERGLPLLAGSRTGGSHRKFVDSFDAPEIIPYFRDFTDSAFWLYGHTALEKASGLGLTGEWAARTFGKDRAAANAFYTEAGKKAPPGRATRARIALLGGEPDPGDVIDSLTPLKL